jgi:hypothetical protein
MRVIFLHNRHDAESRHLLETFLADPNLSESVEVVDVFSYPPPKMPEGLRPWVYPAVYLRRFVVLEPDSLEPSTSDGVLTVKVGCFNLDGTPANVDSEPLRYFYVYVNGVLYGDSPALEQVDIADYAAVPVLVFRFTVVPGVKLHLRVEADEYIPFDEVFTVAAG